MDSQGNSWRPCTEWVTRAGNGFDVVRQTWWTERRRLFIDGTPDPEIYRYGVRAPEFWVNVTVAPETYHVRLKFMEAFEMTSVKRPVTVLINGEERVKDMDIAATAGGPNRAVDLVFNGIKPVHGVIELRFRSDRGGEAMVQAIEVGAGDGGPGATPVAAAK
jgi:hypothetical protein